MNQTHQMNPDKQLPQEEDQTAALGFEPVVRNTVPIPRGYCPQCIEPMGMKGRTTIKVIISEGEDHWCEHCYNKGEKEGVCIKWRSLSKKEKKAVRKQLKKLRKEKQNE